MSRGCYLPPLQNGKTRNCDQDEFFDGDGSSAVMRRGLVALFFPSPHGKVARTTCATDEGSLSVISDSELVERYPSPG